MSSAAIPLKTNRKLRCLGCGTAGEFPANFTKEDVADCCVVCHFHFTHESAHDFRCAICIAQLWQSRLRAIRILLFNPPLLRLDDEG